MFDFTKKVIISSLLFAVALNADFKEVPKNEIAQMEQLELFKRAQIKIVKAFDAGSLYILNINVQGNPDEIYLTKDKKMVLAGDVIDVSDGMKITAPADVAFVTSRINSRLSPVTTMRLVFRRLYVIIAVSVM